MLSPGERKNVWLRISVVTPNYNYAEFLENSICSVLAQGYPNLEYIVIDDGSEDRSVDIITKHAGSLTFWTQQEHGGQARALNEGFSRSTGEIMAWLNSDDIYAPEALFLVAEIFDKYKDINWLIGHSAVCDKVGLRRFYEEHFNRIYGNDYKRLILQGREWLKR